MIINSPDYIQKTIVHNIKLNDRPKINMNNDDSKEFL